MVFSSLLYLVVPPDVIGCLVQHILHVVHHDTTFKAPGDTIASCREEETRKLFFIELSARALSAIHNIEKVKNGRNKKNE